MHWLIIRYFVSLGNVALALVMAVLALGYCAVYQRPFLLQLFKQAAQIRDHLVSAVSWPDGEIVARLVLHESSLVLMFFTLAARAALGLVQLMYAIATKRYD